MLSDDALRCYKYMGAALPYKEANDFCKVGNTIAKLVSTRKLCDVTKRRIILNMININYCVETLKYTQKQSLKEVYMRSRLAFWLFCLLVELCQIVCGVNCFHSLLQIAIQSFQRSRTTLYLKEFCPMQVYFTIYRAV